MARAQTVWVVSCEGNLVAAFTVKHELKTWLSHQVPEVLTAIKLYRVPDGGKPGISDVLIGELL